jgi:drug/metabolite transporter (DMT)-like permease
MLSDEVAADSSEEGSLNSITLAAGGLIVGAATTGTLGVTGVMPLTFTTNDTVIAGLTMSWIVPIVLLGVITTAIAYTLGIMGIARLRPRFASLVGLSEVMFAVLAAWILLGQAITLTQAIGGAVVLVGLALARQGDRGEKVHDATWPDAGTMDQLTPCSRANG